MLITQKRGFTTLMMRQRDFFNVFQDRSVLIFMTPNFPMEQTHGKFGVGYGAGD